MAVSSLKLAKTLATRLNEIVPASFQVDAEGNDVGVYSNGVAIGGSGAPAIVDDDDGRSIDQKLETAARAVLSAVQDTISESLREAWPSVNRRVMALPGAHLTGGELRLWYGDQAAPVARIGGIAIADIEEL